METILSIADLISYIEQSYDKPDALNDHIDGSWVAMSHKEFIHDVKAIAVWLKEVGLNEGDKVGILALPSAKWSVADLACAAAGLVSVPLFGNISNENFVFECTQTGVKTIFVSGEEQWKMWESHKDLFTRVIGMDKKSATDGIITYDMVVQEGQNILKKNPDAFKNLLSKVKPEDIATIIYTSGSTGIPKGAMLTHTNLITTASCGELDILKDDDRYLSIIPLAHVLGRSLNLIMLQKGIKIYYFNDHKNVGVACREIHPTVITLVPRLLEKIYAKMVGNIDSAGFLKRTIGHWAFSLANEEEGGLYKNLMHPVADKVVYSHLREALGGEFRVIISGGAALNPHLCRFFIDIGLPIYEGYGLTESSVVCVNLPNAQKIGSVGKALEHIQAKTSPEGELLLKGGTVFKGYYNNPKATQEVFDADGWLKTGDMATIDDEGFITIVGRQKELYKSSVGEYIAPVPIEQQLGKAPIIDMSMLVADKRKFVSCLIFPNFEVIQNLKKAQGMEGVSDEEFLESDYIKNEMKTLLDSINSHLNHWEQIHAYRFIMTPPTVEGGELTPSMKIRRNVVESKYKSVIDSMYPEEAHL